MQDFSIDGPPKPPEKRRDRPFVQKIYKLYYSLHVENYVEKVENPVKNPYFSTKARWITWKSKGISTLC